MLRIFALFRYYFECTLKLHILTQVFHCFFCMELFTWIPEPCMWGYPGPLLTWQSRTIRENEPNYFVFFSLGCSPPSPFPPLYKSSEREREVGHKKEKTHKHNTSWATGPVHERKGEKILCLKGSCKLMHAYLEVSHTILKMVHIYRQVCMP